MRLRSTQVDGIEKMAIGQAWPWMGGFERRSSRPARMVRWFARVVTVSGDTRHIRDAPAGSARSAVNDRVFKAFETLLQGRERDVFGYLWHLTGDEQTAYDLCQETFLRAWQHFAKLETYENPGAWLFRVATNLALNHRQRRTLPTRPTAELGEDEGPSGEDPASDLARRDLIARTLLRLPDRRRAALILREIYGLSSGEIAGMLRVTPAAAKMTVSRAREEFRRCYALEEVGQ
jgi:RNA polymerase sigma-70 factor, ECF subfamily